MAGKFLTLEETARQLGKTVDDVQRLVDRKKLFPMRDGATIKFKVDDVERLMQDLDEEVSPIDDLDLGDVIDAGDSLFADGGAAPTDSKTLLRGADAPDSVVAGGSGLSISDIGGGSAADIVLGDSAISAVENDDLALESIVGASSIGAASAALSGTTGGPGEIDETLAIDLDDAGPAAGDGSLVVGTDSAAGGQASAGGQESSIAGLSISGALDSGLSLEDGTVAMSGIDLGGDGAAAADDGTVLGGDDFELGAGGGDEESASVVIAESESTESSFFGQAMAGEGSSAFGDESAGLPSSIASEAAVMPGDYGSEPGAEMGFSGLQLAGLICCSLLLLFGGFIAYDLVRTIGSSESTTLANPLLDAMAGTFGWR